MSLTINIELMMIVIIVFMKKLKNCSLSPSHLLTDIYKIFLDILHSPAPYLNYLN